MIDSSKQNIGTSFKLAHTACYPLHYNNLNFSPISSQLTQVPRFDQKKSCLDSSLDRLLRSRMLYHGVIFASESVFVFKIWSKWNIIAILLNIFLSPFVLITLV